MANHLNIGMSNALYLLSYQFFETFVWYIDKELPLWVCNSGSGIILFAQVVSLAVKKV